MLLQILLLKICTWTIVSEEFHNLVVENSHFNCHHSFLKLECFEVLHVVTHFNHICACFSVGGGVIIHCIAKLCPCD